MIWLRRWCRLSCVVLALCVAKAAVAQAGGNDAEQADRDALRALIPIYEQAANQGKPELLKPLLDPEFSGVMVTGEEVTSFPSLETYWANMQKLMGEGGRYQTKVSLIDHAKLSGDLAVAHGTTQDVVNAKGSEYQFQGRWTAVCRKRDGQWKLLRIQSSMDPIGNPFVSAAAGLASMKAGAVAGVVGLLAGWLMGMVMGRRCKRPAAA